MSLIDMLMTQEARIKPFERYAGGKALYGIEEVRKCRMEFGKIECEGTKMRVIQCSQMHGFGAYSHLEVQLE